MSSSQRGTMPRPASPCARPSRARSTGGRDTTAETPRHGINIRDLLSMWRARGGVVEQVRRHGELRLHHPSYPGLQSSKFTQSRKDTTRDTVLFVRRIFALLDATAANPRPHA